ncbi:hypothetical protein [Microbacterium gilvum]|uniref:Uncharacterized protein n=1 Tax=Microbacterium gilvum TaxID=1336204 RepID=A0ABP8ZRH8_9MICO
MVLRQAVARRAMLAAVAALTVWCLGVAGASIIVARTFGGDG